MAKLSFLISVVLAAVVISGVAVAQDKPGLDGERVKQGRLHRGRDRETPTPEALLERLTRHLDLNEMQQESISELMGAALGMASPGDASAVWRLLRAQKLSDST